MADVVLEVSFYGPFVFVLNSKTVVVYAPRCVGHLASVQADTDEQALLGCGYDKKQGYKYQLRDLKTGKLDFGASGLGQTRCANPKDIILVETWRKKWEPLDPDHGKLTECHFALEVPRPHIIQGLILDEITVTEYDLENASSWHQRKATAMRFYYCGIDRKRKFEVFAEKAPTPRTVIEIESNPPEPQTHVPLVFRYASHGIFDRDHRDAEECFLQMRALVPPLGAWKVDFDDQPMERLGSDCKTSPLLFLSYEEKEQWVPGKALKGPKSGSSRV